MRHFSKKCRIHRRACAEGLRFRYNSVTYPMSDFSLHARAKTYDMCKGNDPQEFKSDVAACRTAIPLHIHTIHKHKGPWVGPNTFQEEYEYIYIYITVHPGNSLRRSVKYCTGHQTRDSACPDYASLQPAGLHNVMLAMYQDMLVPRVLGRGTH